MSNPQAGAGDFRSPEDPPAERPASRTAPIVVPATDDTPVIRAVNGELVFG